MGLLTYSFDLGCVTCRFPQAAYPTYREQQIGGGQCTAVKSGAEEVLLYQQHPLHHLLPQVWIAPHPRQ